MTFFPFHLPRWKRMEKMMALEYQSRNMAICTPIIPSPIGILNRYADPTLKAHMLMVDTIIGNITSPAALNTWGRKNAGGSISIT